MAHFFGLESRLTHIDSDVSLKPHPSCAALSLRERVGVRQRFISERDHIGGAIHPSEASVEFLDPPMPCDVHREFNRASNMLASQRVCGERFKVLLRI